MPRDYLGEPLERWLREMPTARGTSCRPEHPSGGWKRTKAARSSSLVMRANWECRRTTSSRRSRAMTCRWPNERVVSLRPLHVTPGSADR